MTPEENLARITEEVNEQMRRFGYILPETSQKLLEAQTGIQNFGFKVQIATNIMGNLADAVGDYTRAMYRGEKGAAVFNKSIDNMVNAAQTAAVALSLLVPGGALMKGVAAGLTFLITQFARTSAELTKTANEQGDTMYSAFSQLAESGAVGADGIEGLFTDIQKLGLNVHKLDKFLAVAGQNADQLALMGGTVAKGRKEFANLGFALRDRETDLRKLGLDETQQAEAIMGFMKIQSRLALGQQKDFSSLSGQTYKYIQEQDALTKVTGLSRKQQEDALDEAMRNQRFAATLDELRAQGKEKEVEQLQLGFQAARAAGKDMGDAYADLASGMVNTEAARKGLITSQGELLRQVEDTKRGVFKDAPELFDQSMQRVFKSTGEFGEKMRGSAKAGVFEDFALQYSTSMKSLTIANNNFAETMAKARQQTQDQINKPTPQLNNQVELLTAQNNAMLTFQKFIADGIPQTFSSNMKAVVTELTTMLTKFGARITGMEPGRTPNREQAISVKVDPAKLGQFGEDVKAEQYGKKKLESQGLDPNAALPTKKRDQPTKDNPMPVEIVGPKSLLDTPAQQTQPPGGPRYNPFIPPPIPARDDGTLGEIGKLFEPKDIIVQLHRGERVLNKNENTDLTKLFGMVTGDRSNNKMSDPQGEMLKIIDSIASGMKLNNKTAGKDVGTNLSNTSSTLNAAQTPLQALADSQGQMLQKLDSIKNNAMPATANTGALLGAMPSLEIDKEAAEQIGQSFKETMGDEFKSAVTNINKLAEQMQSRGDLGLQQQMVGLLEEIRRSQASTAKASERLAQVASN